MPWPSCFKFDRVEREFSLALFAAGPPAFTPIAIRQSDFTSASAARSCFSISKECGRRVLLLQRDETPLDEGLALGAPHEASARDLSRKLGEPVEREVAVKIARETFPIRRFVSRSRSRRMKYPTTRSATMSAAPAITALLSSMRAVLNSANRL
jgi:hypothetical protein